MHTHKIFLILSSAMVLQWMVGVSLFAEILPNSEYIYVHGMTDLEVIPDIALIQFSIHHIHEHLAEAKADVDRRSHDVIQLTKHLGIADKDITATQLYVHPAKEYEEGKKIFEGHKVSRNIEIVLRDIALYNDLIQGIIAIGINEIERTRMISSQQEESEAQALTKAIEHAKQKAQVIASQFDAQVGPIFGVSEIPLYQNPYEPRTRYESGSYRRREVVVSEDGVFSPGTITISKDIYAIFRLIPNQ